MQKTLTFPSHVLRSLFVEQETGRLMAESEVTPWSQDWLIAAGAYLSFRSMKRLGVFYSPWTGS